MNISFDLDNVIFDLEPLYMKSFDDSGLVYYKPELWDVKKCYPEHIAKKLLELFGDDCLYNMPLLDEEIPYIINNIMDNNNFNVSFVTERLKKQPIKTHNQLLRSGIICSRNQVFDKKPPKIEVLKQIKTDLHFDDSPNVINDCLKNHIDVIMISNDKTLYNHYLRSRVEHYKDLKTALLKTRIYTR